MRRSEPEPRIRPFDTKSQDWFHTPAVNPKRARPPEKRLQEGARTMGRRMEVAPVWHPGARPGTTVSASFWVAWALATFLILIKPPTSASGLGLLKTVLVSLKSHIQPSSLNAINKWAPPGDLGTCACNSSGPFHGAHADLRISLGPTGRIISF